MTEVVSLLRKRLFSSPFDFFLALLDFFVPFWTLGLFSCPFDFFLALCGLFSCPFDFFLTLLKRALSEEVSFSVAVLGHGAGWSGQQVAERRWPVERPPGREAGEARGSLPALRFY